MPKLQEFTLALDSAGPVRGESYDLGRFKLRHLCCPKCAGLIDVQVALGESPRPHIELDFS